MKHPECATVVQCAWLPLVVAQQCFPLCVNYNLADLISVSGIKSYLWEILVECNKSNDNWKNCLLDLLISIVVLLSLS